VNTGAPRSISDSGGVLDGLRGDLKTRRFTLDPVREKMIPKARGKVRRLGIATSADRFVQAVLKLVLEPIFETDFKPCSYGFRPKRRAQDAIAEIHFLGSPPPASTSGCSRQTSRRALTKSRITVVLDRLRARIKDKRILALVKAFLAAGVLSEDGVNRDTITGTPQGQILSPLLATVLDEHFTRKWEALGPDWARAKLRRQGVPVYRLVRYADDFVVMVGGSRGHAEALWDEVGAVLAPMGLRLSVEKTRVCHIDEGFDFLGYRIQRRSWRGRPGKRAVYTYPSKKALASVMAKVRSLTRLNATRARGWSWWNLNHGPAGARSLSPTFTMENGRPVSPDYTSKSFPGFLREVFTRCPHCDDGHVLEGRCNECGEEAEVRVPTITFHGLRHSCANLLFAQGCSLRLVMEILGHSQIALTANTYTHLLPEADREAATAMQTLLGSEK